MRISDWSSDVCSSDLARGNVELVREGNRLRADEVVWNRATGEVRANGNISVTNPQGDIAYGDSIELTDTLKDGIVENLLLVLENGGRLAARRGTRAHEIITLDHAAYSPCAVEDSEGCPKEPTRSEAPTSELQSLMRISYAVFCLKKKTKNI